MMTPLNILDLTKGRLFTPDGMKRHLGYADAAPHHDARPDAMVAAPGTAARIARWLGRRLPGTAYRASEREAKG